MQDRRLCLPQSVPVVFLAVFLVALSVCASAHEREMAGNDASEDRFPQPYDSEPGDAEPMPPEDAAAGFRDTLGLTASVFAAEPMVRNPIAMTFGNDDSLWVAENYTYAERTQRFDLSLRDRVIVLRDEDGDGRADRRDVFVDDVQMLTSVEVGDDGVWLMCPPRLLFVPNADGNGVPDGPPVVRLDGFEVANENYHNFANGLRFGPDGWLYGRCGGSCPGRVGVPGTPEDLRVALEGGLWRFHPQTDRFEVLCHGTTNPWGHDWTRMGQAFFINTVNGHLWHAIPGAHFERPFTLDPNPHVYELIDQHADHYHFDTGKAWHESRDGAAADFGGGHAHIGMAILKKRSLPAELRDRVVTWNFHGRRLNVEELKRHGSGFVARHQPDRFFAADPFFRGMEIRESSTGDLFAIDWSDTGECHENTGVHRSSGRVYRFAVPRKSAVETVEPDTPAVAAVDAEATIAAMYARHRERPFTTEDLEHSRNDPNDAVRAVAVALTVDHLPIDDVFGPVSLTAADRAEINREAAVIVPLLETIAATDKSGLVKLAVASALQRLPVQFRPRVATALVQDGRFANDHNLPLLVWYGLIAPCEGDPVAVADVAAESSWPRTTRLIARRLAGTIDSQPAAVDRLVEIATAEDRPRRRAIIEGLEEGFRGWRDAPKPTGFDDLAAAVRADPNATDSERATIQTLQLLFGGGRGIESVRQLVLDESAAIGLRRSALEALVAKASGPEVESVCLAVLSDPRLNVPAARGLAGSADPNVARQLIRHYRRFRSPQRPKVIAILASRPRSAMLLLDAVEEERIPRGDLTAYDVRQMRVLGDEVASRVAETWGQIRDTPAELQSQIAALHDLLTAPPTEPVDLARGRRLFDERCSKCHQMFGEGQKIGPDLTGADRGNLDYLLQNVVSPSSIVSTNYRMTLLQLDDGRILSGLVTRADDRTLTIQTQTELVTVSTDEIDQRKMTDQSPMPTGLVDTLGESDLRALFAYLQSPVQVSRSRE